MSNRCASRFACGPRGAGNTVDASGYWCRACQEQEAVSSLAGSAVTLAMVPNLNPVYQPILLNSSSVMARMQLAHRADLDPRIRRQLLHDSDSGVALIAAASPANDPIELYRLLMDVTDRDLLMALAGNRSLPLRGLWLLRNAPDKEISARARQTLVEISRSTGNSASGK